MTFQTPMGRHRFLGMKKHLLISIDIEDAVKSGQSDAILDNAKYRKKVGEAMAEVESPRRSLEKEASVGDPL
jgi:hypothetical protein